MINNRREWTLDTCTVDDIRQLVRDWAVLEIPGDQVVRVVTRVEFRPSGARIRHVRLTDT